MKVLCCIQARVDSQRLPKKVLYEICGVPLISHIIRRLSLCSCIDKIVLATSLHRENDALENIASVEGVDSFRGDEEDVMKRFYQVVGKYDPEHIVRVCADNPLIDPLEVDRIIRHHLKTKADYSFNHTPAMNNNYPDGVGAEIFRSAVIKDLFENKKLNLSEREHINEYIWNNLKEFHIETLKAPLNIADPEVRLDVDVKSDLDFVEDIYQALYKGEYFSTENVLEYIRKNNKVCSQ